MMTAAPIFELRLVSADGTLDRYLPDYASIDMSPVYCDAGTIQFSYPEKGVNYNLLHEDLEIAVTMNGVEIPELRSLIESIEGDDATDEEGGTQWKFTARTAVGKLDDAIVYPGNMTTQLQTKPTPATYTSKNVGEILVDLFTKARNRGALANYTWDFNTATDSEGNAWLTDTDLVIDTGKSYLDLMKELNGNGLLEFRVDGRVIRCWEYGKMGVDRSVGTNPLRFYKGRDIRESPRKVNTKGLKTYVLVGGNDNSVFQETHNSDAFHNYGRREVFWSAGSTKYATVAGFSTLVLAGTSYLDGVSSPQLEVTHGLHFETEDQPRPFTNFNVGDWALTDVGKGVERFRILQWVISVASDGSCTGSITMNWLFNTQLSQVNSAINAIENGATNAGTAPKNDGVKPGQVTGVIPTSGNYFLNNISRATLTIAWDELTVNEDGSEMFDLDYYLAYWKYTTDSGWRSGLRVEAEDDQSFVTVTNLDPGAAVQVRVQGVDLWGNKGAFSAIVPITLAGDSIPPNKPAPPTVTSNVGTLRVVWSGLDFNGVAMPVDLAGVEVHVSTSDFTPSAATKKDVLPPGVLATTLTQGLTYGQEYWVKLVAFDTTGNKSTPSDTTSTTHVVLKQVVSTEIGTGQVGLGQTTFSDVGNLIDDGSFEFADKRTARSALIGIQHLSFDNATASNGIWSIRSDPWAGTSNESVLLQGSLPVKPGERVFGAADYRQTADVPAGSFLTLAVKWVDKSGNYLSNTGTVSNVFYTLSDNGFAAKDNVWHSRVTNVSQVAPPNAVTAEIWLIAQSRTAGQIWIDSVEVRKQIDTLLIQQAAITNALIADLAVNNAKISDLNVGKLTAGTLSADVVLGARIKTADTGARVEVNSGGIGAWNTAGTQTVSIAGADGSVSIVGTLKSGTTGKRLEINPTSTFLPEIRFYANSGTDYGFINGVSSGSDVSVGVQSSPWVDGTATVASRTYQTSSFARLEVINLSDESRRGGYVWAGAGALFLGFNRDGTDYGHFYGDQVQAHVGWKHATSDAQEWRFFSGRTEHTGTWANFLSADSTDGLFTGTVLFSSAAAASISYGPTMDSNMVPVTNPVASNFGTATPTVWGIHDFGPTSFTVSWNNTQGMRINFWCFRV